MATTVLSGTSGALYYKPAGTTATFGTADVTTGTDTLTVGTYLGFRVGDPVQFSVVNTTTGGSGTGTLPAGLAPQLLTTLLRTQPLLATCKCLPLKAVLQ